MKLSKGNRDLILHGSLVKAVFTIAIPVVVNSFLQTMYNLTDTYWLGQLSVDYLAAINLVSPVQNTVINFGSGVTVAGAVMISQYIGAGKPEMARKIANQIFTVAMLFSLLCASVMAVATPVLSTFPRANVPRRSESVSSQHKSVRSVSSRERSSMSSSG